jgi:hypothetical protein
MPRWVSTGWDPLDHLLGGGLPIGDVTVLAGPPVCGKSRVTQEIRVRAPGWTTYFECGNAMGPNPIENIFTPSSLTDLTHMVGAIRRTSTLLIIDGIQLLPAGIHQEDQVRVAEGARIITSLFRSITGTQLAVLLTWQLRRRVSGVTAYQPLPSGVAHTAGTILQLNPQNQVEVTKSRYQEHGSILDLTPMLNGVPNSVPEPAFDRSCIKTRFEREDII